MRIDWEVDSEDVQWVQALVDGHRCHPDVQDRIRWNVERQGLTVTREVVWAEMVGCLVSTQQPWKKAERFLRQEPFPLSYDLCRESQNPRDMVLGALSKARLRRSQRITEDLCTNLNRLEGGLWADTLGALEGLLAAPDRGRERTVADFIDDKFAGFGPKQARNLLQGLGLTRYEIPVDSRMAKWLAEMGFGPICTESLADRRYYHSVLDNIQNLCAHCDVYPCVLDAVVFVSFERK